MNQELIARLRSENEWLLSPVEEAVKELNSSEFYHWLSSISAPVDFRMAALQIYHHSATLPLAIGMILSKTPMDRRVLYQTYARHAFEEADHHLLLEDWMRSHNLIFSPEDLAPNNLNSETRNCINIAYEIAAHGDHDLWLAVINCGIELCAHEFFKRASPKMSSMGCGHNYFDIHVEADALHSVMGLEYFVAPKSPEGKLHILNRTLDAVEKWKSMIHSWIP